MGWGYWGLGTPSIGVMHVQAEELCAKKKKKYYLKIKLYLNPF